MSEVQAAELEKPEAAPEAEESTAVPEEPATVLEEPVSLPVEPFTEQLVEKAFEDVVNASEVSTEMTKTTEAMPEPETVTEAATPEPAAESDTVPEPVSEALSVVEVEAAVPSLEKPTPITEPESQTAAPPEATLTQAMPEPSPEPSKLKPAPEESIPSIVILESTSSNEISLEETVPTVTDLKLDNGVCESSGSAEQSVLAPLEVNGECHEQAPEVAPMDVPKSPAEECVNGVKEKEPPLEQSDCELKKDLSLAADIQVPSPIGDMVEVPQ
ncbi:calphotin-like [Xyrauchen texanus]|uniref:calphotin-like n=1 Tax=Xyrauchen texanus TaxID=154827 RepID=UPI0022428646|nr:calphotin-like [Xyrauchen texanus]